MGLCRAVEMFHQKNVTIIVHEMNGSTTTWIATADPALAKPGELWFGPESKYKEALQYVMGS